MVKYSICYISCFFCFGFRSLCGLTNKLNKCLVTWEATGKITAESRDLDGRMEATTSKYLGLNNDFAALLSDLEN